MDYYDRDSKKVEIDAIYGRGREHQVVVLANVSLSPDNLFAGYPQPYIFTIIKKLKGEKRDEGYYVVTDAEGKEIEIKGDMAGYFYDANEYARWNEARHKEEIRRQEKIVGRENGELELLKDIMKSQGVRVITKEQAEFLGLKV